jgi:hypothetical protein
MSHDVCAFVSCSLGILKSTRPGTIGLLCNQQWRFGLLLRCRRGQGVNEAAHISTLTAARDVCWTFLVKLERLSMTLSPLWPTGMRYASLLCVAQRSNTYSIPSCTKSPLFNVAMKTHKSLHKHLNLQHINPRSWTRQPQLEYIRTVSLPCMQKEAGLL